MAFDYKYNPIIKGKNYCPNPIAKFGIPRFADSRANKKVIGTVPWEQWWNEQMEYLINGYTTGGIFIPPNYYWYLNFCMIATIGRGFHYPDPVDLDLEYFRRYKWIKENNRGGIDLKKRRGGLSEKYAKGIIGYGMYMKPEKYNAGICAGLDDYVTDMRMKFRELNSLLPPELRLRFKLSDTDDLIQSGWTDANGDPQGSQNMLFCRTMFNNPNVFKGKFLDDVGFEEAGEFKHLTKGYSATIAGLKVGLDMIGTPMVYGTSGKSGSKEFRAMLADPNAFHLEKMFIPGYRIVVGFFVGSTDSKGVSTTPNIDKLQQDLKLSREQVLGCEDVEAADAMIMRERENLKNSKNPETRLEHYLDFPRTEAEALMAAASNHFDRDAIASQQAYLLQQPVNLYDEYVFEYVKTEDGQIEMPRKVIMRPPKDTDRPYERVKVRRGFEIPLHEKGYKHAYSGGVDSYDQDKSLTSKSLGAMSVMLRKGHPYKNAKGEPIGHKRIPVMTYFQRPPRKEIFYEICMMASIYWNLQGMTMIDAGRPLVIEHYKTNGCRHLLAPRPKSFESGDSQQSHDFGMILTGGKKGKQQMLSVSQTYVIDELDECVFEELVNNYADYNEIEDESDWDLADANGLAIVADIDRKLLKPEKVDNSEETEKEWRWDPSQQTYVLTTVEVRKEVSQADIMKAKPEHVSSLIFQQMIDNGSYQ